MGKQKRQVCFQNVCCPLTGAAKNSLGFGVFLGYFFCEYTTKVTEVSQEFLLSLMLCIMFYFPKKPPDRMKTVLCLRIAIIIIIRSLYQDKNQKSDLSPFYRRHIEIFIIPRLLTSKGCVVAFSLRAIP